MVAEVSHRVILHLDMDAFFASVEQRANPFLRGKPVLVCGNRSARTVVATASYEARAFGVRTGMNLPEALRLCPQAVLVEGDPAKYLDAFHRVAALMERYTPEVEVSSIDEAFADLSKTAPRFGGPWQIARAIQAAVHTDPGLSCSLGIGPNRLIAKLASSRRKPNGITWIHPEDLPGVLEELPVEELCGIGPRLAALLREAHGIVTCGQLARVPVERLVARCGQSLGRHLAALARGQDDSPVVPGYRAEPAKSMGHLQTLAHNTASLHVLQAVLLNLAEKVGRRLRQDGAAGRTVCLTVREADFTTHTRQQTLPRFLDDGYEIYRVGAQILKTLPVAKPVRMLGISVSGLAGGERQGEWLPEAVRRRRLVQAADRINDRFGEGTVTRAALHVSDEPSSHYQLKRYSGAAVSRLGTRPFEFPQGRALSEVERARQTGGG